MRILVLGAGGMMGHMACRVLGARDEVFGSIRQTNLPTGPLGAVLPPDRWVPGVDTNRIDSVAEAIAKVRPDVVFNAVGIVKQLEAAHDAILSIEVNALLPHRLAVLCSAAGVRFLHLSTDCVFSGDRGNYAEKDRPDPVDLYGRTKLLGETAAGEGLTIRTSIVGRQISGRTSLFEWVLANRGNTVRGFEGAVYSGLTTMALADVVGRIVHDHPDLTGLWQIASTPITKYALLHELDRRLGLDLTIERDDEFRCDRSLDGTAFREETGIEVPSWDAMLDEFAADQPFYEGIGLRP